jgi:hypothetical protein
MIRPLHPGAGAPPPEAHRWSVGYEKSGAGFRCLAWSLEATPAWANIRRLGSGVSPRLRLSGVRRSLVHKSVHEAVVGMPGRGGAVRSVGFMLARLPLPIAAATGAMLLTRWLAVR